MQNFLLFQLLTKKLIWIIYIFLKIFNTIKNFRQHRTTLNIKQSDEWKHECLMSFYCNPLIYFQQFSLNKGKIKVSFNIEINYENIR